MEKENYSTAVATGGEDQGDLSLDVIPDSSSAGVRDWLKRLPQLFMARQILLTLGVVGRYQYIATNASAKEASVLVKTQDGLFSVLKAIDATSLMLQSFQSGANNILEKLKVAYLYLLDGFPDFAKTDIDAIAKDIKTMRDSTEKALGVVGKTKNSIEEAHRLDSAVKNRREGELTTVQQAIDQLNDEYLKLNDGQPNKDPKEDSGLKPSPTFFVFLKINTIAFLKDPVSLLITVAIFVSFFLCACHFYNSICGWVTMILGMSLFLLRFALWKVVQPKRVHYKPVIPLILVGIMIIVFLFPCQLRTENAPGDFAKTDIGPIAKDIKTVNQSTEKALGLVRNATKCIEEALRVVSDLTKTNIDLIAKEVKTLKERTDMALGLVMNATTSIKELHRAVSDLTKTNIDAIARDIMTVNMVKKRTETAIGDLMKTTDNIEETHRLVSDLAKTDIGPIAKEVKTVKERTEKALELVRNAMKSIKEVHRLAAAIQQSVGQLYDTKRMLNKGQVRRLDGRSTTDLRDDSELKPMPCESKCFVFVIFFPPLVILVLYLLYRFAPEHWFFKVSQQNQPNLPRTSDNGVSVEEQLEGIRRDGKEKLEEKQRIEESTGDIDLTKCFLNKALTDLKSVTGIIQQSTAVIEKWYKECKDVIEPSMGRTIQRAQTVPEEELGEYWNSMAFKKEVVGYYCRWRALQVYCETLRSECREKRATLESHYVENLYPREAVKRAWELANEEAGDLEVAELIRRQKERMNGHDLIHRVNNRSRELKLDMSQ